MMRLVLSHSFREQLNKFKALVVGDSGIFNAKLRHAPAEVNILLERLSLPIVVMSASRYGDHYTQMRFIRNLEGYDARSTAVRMRSIHGMKSSALPHGGETKLHQRFFFQVLFPRTGRSQAP